MDKRKLLKGSMAAVGAVGAGAVGKILLETMKPTDAVRDSYETIIDISNLRPGEFKQAEFRNAPVLVMRRTEDQIKKLEQANSFLLDPDSQTSQQPVYATNRYRSIRPDVFVVIPVCTHLGCMANEVPPGAESPAENVSFIKSTDWTGGFLCPCHGALFDHAGRVYKDKPAPVNMLIPEHRYRTHNEIELFIKNPDA